MNLYPKTLAFIRSTCFSPTRCKRYLFSGDHQSLPLITELRNELIEKVKICHTLTESMNLSQSSLAPRRMHDSYAACVLPFGRDKSFRERYINFLGGARVGLLLEDLDTLAGVIAARHYQHPSGNALLPGFVTALVDRINFQRSPSINTDCIMHGRTSWVGNSSMEITMFVEQMEEGGLVEVLRTNFLMVGLDRASGRPCAINTLQAVTEEERRLLAEGQERKQVRQQQQQASLSKRAPTDAEQRLIHSLFLETLDSSSGSLMARIRPPGAVWLADTSFKHLVICHPQAKNIHNKIFGGFLMRIAFELGWSTAFTFMKSRPRVLAVDDILFRKPVEIGSLLSLTSHVAFTTADRVQVRVLLEALDVESGMYDTTNILNMTFYANNRAPVLRVVPHTYAEAMLYLDGKRHFESSMSPT